MGGGGVYVRRGKSQPKYVHAACLSRQPRLSLVRQSPTSDARVVLTLDVLSEEEYNIAIKAFCRYHTSGTHKMLVWIGLVVQGN